MKIATPLLPLDNDSVLPVFLAQSSKGASRAVHMEIRKSESLVNSQLISINTALFIFIIEIVFLKLPPHLRNR
jgi:hypothetical protein